MKPRTDVPAVPRAHRAYGHGPDAVSTDRRPLVALDVDGVIALDTPPAVPATSHDVTAWGKWRRRVTIGDGTAEVIRTLAAHCEIAWATAWSYNAHEAFRDVLALPSDPWPFLPVQFDAATTIATYAGARRWAWITETTARPGTSAHGAGLIVTVGPRHGLPSIDTSALLTRLGAA